MKIIQVNKLYAPWIGGVESHVQSISEGLLDLAVVHVLCSNTKPETKIELIKGVKVFKYASLGRFFSLPISLAFLKAFKTHKADIFHLHLPNPLAVLAFFLTRPKGKIIVTWHSDIIKQRFFLFFYKPLLNWFLRQSDTIIVTSPNMKQYSKHLRRFQNKIKVVPLGIAPKLYLNKVCKPLSKEPYALFVGRLVYYKGVLELIEALAKTRVRLIIVGEGSLRPLIENKASQLIQEKRLIIYPHQDKASLNNLFKYCQFLVLPSTHASEAFGIVQLEAMIHAKPVISTNLPTGVPYVNKHGQTGLIVEPNNPEILAKAMDKLWQDDALRARLGAQAYQRCQCLFTEEKMIERIKKIVLLQTKFD